MKLAMRRVREPKPSPELIALFWSNVTKSTDEDGCWIWNNKPDVYGRFEWRAAHVWMWIHILGRKAPKGMHLHHNCKTKGCVNGNHLELLSPKDHSNRHIRHLVIVTVDGITDTGKKTAIRVGLAYSTLRFWMNRGYPPQLICDRWRSCQKWGFYHERLFKTFETPLSAARLDALRISLSEVRS